MFLQVLRVLLHGSSLWYPSNGFDSAADVAYGERGAADSLLGSLHVINATQVRKVQDGGEYCGGGVELHNENRMVKRRRRDEEMGRGVR